MLDNALLVGNTRANSVLNFGGSFRYKSPNNTRIVDAITGKLGVDYSFGFANDSNLKFELGYQASVYFNPFDMIRGELPPTQRIIGLETTTFSYNGPYLSAVWIM